MRKKSKIITQIVGWAIFLLFEQGACADPIDANKIYNESQAAALSEKSKLLSLQDGAGGIDQIQKVLQNNEGEARGKATELGDLPKQGEVARQNVLGEDKISCTKDDCNVANVLSTGAVTKREIQLDRLGFKKDKEDFPVNTKGYLDSVNQKTKEYSEKYNAISGAYKDCKPVDSEFSYKEKTICDEYYDVKHSHCPISQVVEIDPKYTYQCNKKRKESIKTCHDEIVSIKCENSGECDDGGIEVSSIQADMEKKYDYPTLTLGMVKDNQWCGKSCAVYDRSTKFKVKNLEKVTEFRLTQVGFDDYLWIKVNGHTVYVGPDGGDRIEVEEGWFFPVVTNGQGNHGCERNTNWNSLVNTHLKPIDLKPYLKEGENEIWMRVIVSGCGEAWMKISARQHCCKNWDIKREQKCEYEEVK
jgi:hypothetical protein